MPIYAYKCSSCGFAKDVLQKISAPPLTVWPSCGASSFAKQVTAASFQLKGSGWYVTDFRNDGGKTDASASGEKSGIKETSAMPATAGTPAAAPAAAPAPAVAPAPASSGVTPASH